jgi:ABC-type multidrug transport system ATPase subunit
VADGATVLLTTQYLEEADRLADRIAVIDRGEVIAEGTPAALKTDLGDTVIDITLADPAEAARAAGVLAPLDHRSKLAGSALEVTVDNGPRALVDVLRALDGADLRPSGITVREPSLDDVFLSLTGHRAEGGAGSPADPAPDRAPELVTARGAA